ncbi:hypothetical protein CB1_000932032 [Camelus ferus]|nr:hypothetical protein CB1_000932032 [Camelus ferus]
MCAFPAASLVHAAGAPSPSARAHGCARGVGRQQAASCALLPGRELRGELRERQWCSSRGAAVLTVGSSRDTAGQERFNSITSAYYRSAKGIILVYDITKKETFDDLPKWMKMIDKYASEDAELLLVGNKLDCETDREISRQQGEKFAQQITGMRFCEASAKDNFNVDEIFLKLVDDILKKMPLDVLRNELSNSILSLQPEPEIPPELPPPRPHGSLPSLPCCGADSAGALLVPPGLLLEEVSGGSPASSQSSRPCGDSSPSASALGFRCALGFRRALGFRCALGFRRALGFRCALGFRRALGFRCALGFRRALGFRVPVGSFLR